MVVAAWLATARTASEMAPPIRVSPTMAGRTRAGTPDPYPVRSGSEGDSQDVKTGDTGKMPLIRGCNAPSGTDGSRCHEPVMCSDIQAGCGQSGPKPGMRTSSEQIEGLRRKRGQDRLDKGLAADPVIRGGTVYTMQQFRSSDSGDPDLFVRPQLRFQACTHFGHRPTGRQAPDCAFKVDEDGGV
jgi:hypothetical protein